MSYEAADPRNALFSGERIRSCSVYEEGTLMLSCVGRLKRLLPPPEEAAGAVDWNVVEESLGVRLPSDYKEFTEVYGGGTILDYFILCLMVPNVGGSIEWWEEEMWNLRHFPDEIPRGYVIDQGSVNLLPWALTIDGDFCYLWMEPRQEPDRWWVVTRTRDMDWSVFEGSMVEFLEEVVAGRRRELWMPRDFPGEEPWFKTTAQYLAERHPE
ncbi:SMI1/KNR4 family protein [Actinopolyspora mortivallis]|uniref:SMI1/KNR4 family protein n=1 Tax=Actinopolyspora mortivallis TaxID=33906 RepID=UPI0015E615E3|nr:SMI1/KNR4 family protein [Actinopolyspora mortivallis]